MQLQHIFVRRGEKPEMDRRLHDPRARLDISLGLLLREVFQRLPVRHDDDGFTVAELDVETFPPIESAQLGLGQGRQGWVLEVGGRDVEAVVDACHVLEEVFDGGGDVAGLLEVGEDGCGRG